MRIKLLKIIDFVLGKVFFFFLPSCLGDSQAINPSGIKKILIIRPGGLGDAVLLIPMLRGLKRLCPGAKIDILCEKRNAGVFGLVPDLINNLYVYDAGFSRLFACFTAKYDLVMDTEQWHRLSAIFAYLNNAPVRIGFDTNRRRKAFTHLVDYSHEDYEVNSFLHLLVPLATVVPGFDPDTPWIDIAGVGNMEKTVLISSGASVKERQWGACKFAAVAQDLIGYGFKVTLVGSNSGAGEAAKIAHLVPASVNLFGKNTLAQTAVLIKNSLLLVTMDSGLMHLAYALGTPTVSLFGSGIQKKWAPRGKRHITINKNVPCSPCTRFGYTPQCKNSLKCIKSITVEEVVQAVKKIIDGGHG